MVRSFSDTQLSEWASVLRQHIKQGIVYVIDSQAVAAYWTERRRQWERIRFNKPIQIFYKIDTQKQHPNERCVFWVSNRCEFILLKPNKSVIFVCSCSYTHCMQGSHSNW